MSALHKEERVVLQLSEGDSSSVKRTKEKSPQQSDTTVGFQVYCIMTASHLAQSCALGSTGHFYC